MIREFTNKGENQKLKTNRALTFNDTLAQKL